MPNNGGLRSPIWLHASMANQRDLTHLPFATCHSIPLPMSKKPAFSRRLILSIFMALLLYGGVTMMLGAISQLMASFEAMSWPTASGKVTRSEVETHSQSVRRRGGDGVRRSSAEEYYTADIEYEFELNGVTHFGNRLTTVQGGNLATKPSVEKTLKKYPVGQTVIVSYKPDDPNQSVLEPGSWGVFFALAGLSLVLITIPAVVLWIVWGPNQGRCISGL